jgi:hypothetical protein
MGSGGAITKSVLIRASARLCANAVLLDALNRHRGKGQQTVRVEHVTVQAGGQAIVGHVETPGGGSQPKSKEQPHAIAYAPGNEMPSANPERSSVPSASDAERSLPDARRNVIGAPKGNKNAFKHGRYTAEEIANRREITALLQTMRALARATGEGE